MTRAVPEAAQPACHDDELLKPVEVAEMLKVDERSVRLWRQQGRFLEGIEIVPGTRRWWRSEVLAWLESKNGGTSR